MKRLTIIALLTGACSLVHPSASQAQSIAQCLEQLALDYQKLSSLKQVLGQLYTGYKVFAKGYNTVKAASEGNFDLHKAFLDGMLLVSPAVRAYPRVGEIIAGQVLLLKEYHAAWNDFRRGGHFSPDELAYMLGVYNNLVNASLKNLGNLAMVLSDSQMRMNDAERLAAIDRIFVDSRSQLDFLDSFNDHNYRLAFQRSLADRDRQTLKTLYAQ